jgi:TonB-dependent receptor
MEKYHQLYRSNPAYFVLNEANAWISHATNSERIQESVTSAYVQGELKLLQNRLALIGGVRFERTADDGLGLQRDRDAIYRHDAAGNVIRGPNNQPVLVTTDPVAQAKLQYLERGARASVAYHDYYPSLNAVWNVRDDFIVRLGYARTMGRPNFGNIIPNLDIDENEAASPGQPGGAVRMRNPALKPWTADNYDLTFEYYFKSTGLASISVFRKDIADPFASNVYLLDAALLAQFGLDAEYEGWELTTTTNSGRGRIAGIELNYQQQLTLLPAWARGVSVFANGTFLDPDGQSESSFGNPVRKSGSWGLSYSRGRVGVRLKWNYVGWRYVSNPTWASDAVRYVSHKTLFDTNVEFRIDRRFSVFFNARNLTHQPTDTRNWSSQSPGYSHPSQRAYVTTRCSIGVKGTF